MYGDYMILDREAFEGGVGLLGLTRDDGKITPETDVGCLSEV